MPLVTGSWYITDLCQALQEYGHVMPVKNVLQKTRQSLKSRMGSMNNAYVTQLSEEKVTLTRYLDHMSLHEVYLQRCKHIENNLGSTLYLLQLTMLRDSVMFRAWTYYLAY